MAGDQKRMVRPRLSKQLGDTDLEGVRKLDQRSETKIFFSPFDRAGE
jgi:hypothetical protein